MFQKISICLAAAVASAACVDTFDEPATGTVAEEMVNGIPVNPENTGVVKLLVNWPSQNKRHGCSGVLLSNDWVLTAAHCFEGGESRVEDALRERGLVFEGITRPSTVTMGSQERGIAEHFMHPTLDAALVRLDYPMTMNNRSDGHRADLYEWGKPALLGQQLHCLGYGLTNLDDTTGQTFGSLWTQQFQVMDVSYAGYISLFSASPGVILWNGDSGGPCFDSAGRVVSVLSYGDTEEFWETNVEEFAPWIRETMYAFGAGVKWNGWACLSGEDCHLADVDGDHIDDLVIFSKSTNPSYIGAVWTLLGTGSGFGQRQLAHNAFCILSEQCRVGDFNGDGFDDIWSFVNTAQSHAMGDIWISLSNGNGTFGYTYKVHDWFGLSADVHVGDVNGDGRDDAITVDHDPYGPDPVWVALSDGWQLGTSSVWHSDFSAELHVDDADGNGRDDLIGFVRDPSPALDGTVLVARSRGTRFGSTESWATVGQGCRLGQVCTTGDVDGNGRADIIEFDRGSTGDVHVSFADGWYTTMWYSPRHKAHDYFCVYDELCRAGDADGDGKADIVAFTQGSGSLGWHGDVWVGLSQFLW